MDKKNIIIFNFFKILFSIIIFIGAVNFENASETRFIILVIVLATYLIIGIIRSFLFHQYRFFYNYSFFIDIVLVYIFEYNSKYLINYFFHSFYIFILFEASLLLERKKSLYIGIVIVLTSLIKYILLIYYKNNLANLSQMSFFTLLNIFVLVVINFAQYQKEERYKKDTLYRELLDAHKKLKEYTQKVEELSKTEERNNIARDLHDTMGHNITGLIMEIEMASRLIKEDTKKTEQLLNNAKKTAREVLLGVREVVDTLKPDKNISMGISSIEELINQFKLKTGVNINFKVEGNIVNNIPIINTILYRIIQESLTNSVRHGKATNIEIIISFLNDRIDFFIKDNGLSEKGIKEGHGLKGIRERVETLNGKVRFYDNEGFVTEGYLPLEVKKFDKDFNSR